MQHRTLRRCAAAGVALSLVLPIAPAAARPRRDRRVAAAARYLASNQADTGAVSGGFSQFGTTADAVLAWTAANRGERQIDRAMRWLEDNVDEATTLGLKSKLLIAVATTGGDTRAFGGHDLVQEIQDTKTEEGQYGGESNTDVGYHVLAMIALEAARVDRPQDAIDWLRDAQCDDGGWQFDEPSSANDDEHCFDSTAENDFASSDTNTTAYASIALSGTPDATPHHDPFAFFRTARDEYKKGWVYDPHGKCTEETLGKEFCYLTDANSTALVLMAYQAAGEEIPRSGDYALMNLQYRLCGKRGGAFAFGWTYDPDTERFHRDGPNVGATVAAVPPIVRWTFGVDYEVTRPVPKRRACR